MGKAGWAPGGGTIAEKRDILALWGGMLVLDSELICWNWRFRGQSDVEWHNGKGIVAFIFPDERSTHDMTGRGLAHHPCKQRFLEPSKGPLG